MILSDEEREELAQFMRNPFYSECIANAPDEACRDYLMHGLIHGVYCGDDPVICRESLEEGLTADDWRYIRGTLAGNDPLRSKCDRRIRDLESGGCENE